MSREQKRMAAIFLCIMGIVGTLMAMKERQPDLNAGTVTETEMTAAETAGDPTRQP